jgi:hypothetical protein
MNIVRAAQLVNLVPQVSAQTNGRANMTRAQSSESIPLCHDSRQVSRQFLEIQLLLVSQLDDGSVGLRVLNQRVRVCKERIQAVAVL